ncbi:MAG: response regulator transcription factor [Bdellovibrio sp.]
MNERILIIEDEPEITNGIKYFLEDSAYSVEVANTGLAGLKAAAKQLPHLIILDLNLPDISGFEICKTLREDKDFNQIPIVVLTGENQIADRTKAFDLGADDYIAKPFDLTELLSRVRRKLEASAKLEKQKIESGDITCGNMTIKNRNHEVIINNSPLKLSSLEFKLLSYMASNVGKLLSRQEILEHVWGSATVSERLIDPHILSLRTKMKECDHSIESIYKGGYILKAATPLL